MGAQTGKKAVEVLESRPVDLVVAELRMPETEGFELLAFLNSRSPFITAIVMSAFWTPELKERLKAFGTFRILSKPTNFSEGAKAINESLKMNSKAGFVRGINKTIFPKKRPIQ